MKKKNCFGLKGYAGGYPSTQEQKDDIKEYIAQYGLEWDTPIKEHPFYKDYLSKFRIDWKVATPPEVFMSAREKDLLVRLVLGSFSSSYSLSLTERWKADPTEKAEVDLRISVESKGQYISKTISELFGLQIRRLFSIYIDEQIHLLMDAEDEDEIEEYREEQQKRLQGYADKMKDISSDGSQFSDLEKILS